MQERVYKTAVCDTDDLKQRLIETWSSNPQTVIDEAVDEWDCEPASKQREWKGRRAGFSPGRALFRKNVGSLPNIRIPSD